MARRRLRCRRAPILRGGSDIDDLRGVLRLGYPASRFRRARPALVGGGLALDTLLRRLGPFAGEPFDRALAQHLRSGLGGR